MILRFSALFAMHTLDTEHGVTVSYERHGGGPALVLVHGSFSDHRTNWEFVLPFFSERFTVYAVARRGRGVTHATTGHGLEEEGLDLAALISAIEQPVYLLGHSYGAHVALCAALAVPEAIRRLVLYEAPWPAILGNAIPAPLQALAEAGDWDAFSYWFFRNVLTVPAADLEHLRATRLWEPIVTDAGASFGDLCALTSYRFDASRFARLSMPVLLQVGSESPRHLYVTEALAAILPGAHISILEGQAHEAMTTAPEEYASAVLQLLAE